MRAVQFAIGVVMVGWLLAACTNTNQPPNSTPGPAEFQAERQKAFAAWQQAHVEGTVPAVEIWECAQCPIMIARKEGEIWAGSDATDPERQPDEPPKTNVSITERFAIARHEVTLGEFRAFVTATQRPMKGGCRTDGAQPGTWAIDLKASFLNPGFTQEDNHPVVCVSWRDAKDYVAWLNSQTSGGYRLPTESEWHLGAFGGGYEFYIWGDTSAAACHYSNVLDASSVSAHPSKSAMACNDRWPATSPVGQYLPGASMQYDVIGNAAEWTSTCLADSENRTGSCSRVIVKGGSWRSAGRELRLASRTALPPYERDSAIGFRIAKSMGGPDVPLADSRAYLIRGRQMLWHMDYKRARSDLDRAMELDPRSSHAISARGWVSVRTNAFDSAQKFFDQALEIDPSNAEAIAGLGICALSQNKPRDAIQQLDKALRIAPDFGMAMSIRAIAHRRAGQLEQSLADAARAMLLSPTDIEILKLRVELRALRREWPAALDEVDKLSRVFPTLPGAQTFAASAYSHLLQDDAAMESATRAIRASETSDSYLLRANVRPWEDTSGARADIEKALDIDPMSSRALEALGKLEARVGNHGAAVRAFTRMLDTGVEGRERTVALVLRGIQYLKLRKPGAARKDFDDAIGAKPSPNVLNNLCWHLMINNTALDQAMEYCDRALELAPNSPAYLDSKATLLLRMRKFAEAIAVYDEAIKLQPGLPNSLYGRGVAAQLRCNCEEAGKADLELAVNAAPSTRRDFERNGMPAPFPPANPARRD